MGGHDGKGKNLTSAKEVVNLAKPHWSKELPVLDMRNQYESTLGLKLNMINWLEDCHTLNLSDIDASGEDHNGLKVVNIHFNSTLMMKIISENNISLELKLLDKNLLANRNIDKLSFFSNGDSMEMKNSFFKYAVKIKKKTMKPEGQQNKICLF